MSQQPTVDPVTPDATTADIIALRRLQDYRAGELATLQARSEKWIAGLAAVTGVLTTAVVIKGPESFSDLSDSQRVLGLPVDPQDLVIALMLVGGLLIAFGLVRAYSAAYGDPLDDDVLRARADEQVVTGAYTAWTSAVAGATKSARTALKQATVATLAGTVLLAVAVVTAWTTPSEKAAGGTSTCFRSGDAVVKVKGVLPEVTKGTITVVPCS